MSTEWPGVLDVDALKPGHVAQVDRLADAARAGDWGSVLALLDAGHGLTANHSRITGRSWFAPLHQAAWLGAPEQVAEQLLRRGAWRSLRTADGDLPSDIARNRGHDHLQRVLELPETREPEQRRFAAWDRHLAALIAERTERLGPVRIRPVQTEVIVRDRLESLWFGYPGMYGGFRLSTHQDRLFVESWSRVVGGSGQAHVITESGCVLVEEGFV